MDDTHGDNPENAFWSREFDSYESFSEWLFAQASRSAARIGRPDLAGDFVAEAYEAAARHPDQIGSLKKYLAGTIRNLAYKEIDQRGRAAALPERGPRARGRHPRALLPRPHHRTSPGPPDRRLRPG